MKKFYIETFGCQMNTHDTEKASYALTTIGYEPASEPVGADLIILNTCMVREKAARKVYHRLNEIKHELKRTSDNKSVSKSPIYGVMGCVAQAEADRIFERSKDVGLVIGTQSISKLPVMLKQLEDGFPRAIDVTLSKDSEFFDLPADVRKSGHIAYITITEGCNKFCSYCIVPFTRGRERSRTPQSIVAEAKALAEQGYKEVHLLGQNVNSYGLSGRYRPTINPGANNDSVTFARLLEMMAQESDLPRIKFTTSFPRDFDEDIVKVIDQYPNLCEWIHLPAQSGSDRILRAMRRGYTRQEYMEKIASIKRAEKDMSITGDIIVGFPGETEDDFNETLSMVAEVEYDGLFIFNYSPRPKTPSAAYTDSVPNEVKTERFTKLQELMRRIQSTRYGRYLGREVEVLVEGASARSQSDLTGHTKCHKVVNFPANPNLIGSIVKVRVTAAKANSLYGELLKVVL